MVWADQHKILQILGNLIRNAEESIAESPGLGGQLTLRTGFSDDDGVFAEVSDSGIGIASEDITKLFQHGYTTKPEGHGFGLHSCANAAGELNGRLTVRSDGVGCGATFRLELPVGQNSHCGNAEVSRRTNAAFAAPPGKPPASGNPA